MLEECSYMFDRRFIGIPKIKRMILRMKTQRKFFRIRTGKGEHYSKTFSAETQLSVWSCKKIIKIN